MKKMVSGAELFAPDTNFDTNFSRAGRQSKKSCERQTDLRQRQEQKSGCRKISGEILHRKSGDPLRRLTFGGRNLFPIWTPDGRYLTFQSDRDGDYAIFKQAADGSGSAERLTRPDTGVRHEPESWNPDGRTLSIDLDRGDQGIFTIDSADGKPKYVLKIQWNC
jgi:Tol biopolymer transport system component